MIEICPWVSWRSYKLGTLESRTIVSDERKGCYYLFEQESSDIWHHIACGINLSSLQKITTEIGCRHEIDRFIFNLQENDLVFGELTECQDVKDEDLDLINTDAKGRENSNLLQEMADWVFDNGFLWSVHWEMTYRCNLKCIHCINPVSHKERNSKCRQETFPELTTNEAIKLLDDLTKLGVFELTLSGGEATLRPDFIDILSYARKKGFSVALLTNGTAISQTLVNKISALWPNLVGISIYSANSKQHDNITNVYGSHVKSINTLRLFAKNGIQIKISSLQMRDTIKGFQLVKDLGNNIGAITEFDISIFPKLNGDSTPQNYAIDSKNELILLAATLGSPIEVNGTSQELKNGLARFSNLENPICRAGWLGITLNPAGEIFPCLLFPKHVGSVRTNTIEEIWKRNILGKNWASSREMNHTKYIKIRDLIKCGTYSYCSYCPMCPGKAYLETGNPLLPAPTNCNIAKARHQAAELLAKGVTRNEIAQLENLPNEFGRMAVLF